MEGVDEPLERTGIVGQGCKNQHVLMASKASEGSERHLH